MATGQLNSVLRQIERLFTSGSVTSMGEGSLLERFVEHRDEAAFAALVARHGPMVLGLCRQMLRDPNDVEDAFQATFLVLVKKAATLRNRELLGNWLYGVAYRVALRARAVSARRRATETPVVEEVAVDHEPTNLEWRPTIHEEIARLPEKYRTPIVLCYLEGLTHEEAADRLHWPIGTVKGRLARARDLLRSRLTRRGIALSSGALAIELARDASAAVPSPLIDSTIQAALAVGAGRSAAAGLFSAQATALSEGVLHTMFLTKLKSAGVSFAVAALVTTGAGVLAFQTHGEPAPAAKVAPGQADYRKVAGSPPAPSKEMMKKAVVPRVGADPISDPVYELARQVFEDQSRLFLGGEIRDVEQLNRWSLRMMEAQVRVGATLQYAAKEHLKRMENLHNATEQLRSKDQATRAMAYETQFFVLEAEKLLAGQGPSGSASDGKPGMMKAARPGADDSGGMMQGPGTLGFGGVGIGGFGGIGGMSAQEDKKRREQEDRVNITKQSAYAARHDESPKNKAIWKKLEEPVSMSFANETPLEDVLKYIKSATSGPTDTGIPIYVDPAGLKEAGATLSSPVILDLEHIPMKTTLRLLLKQLKLAYCVKDGVLMISSVNGIMDELEETPDPDER